MKAKSPTTAKKLSGIKNLREENTRSDWRISTLARIRDLIHAADPEIIEERKWIKPTNPAGVAAFSHAGLICTLETYKNYIKLTFARGASLPDPDRLFNASLEGNARRAIDIRENDKINGSALKQLIRAAVAFDLQKKNAQRRSSRTRDL